MLDTNRLDNIYIFLRAMKLANGLTAVLIADSDGVFLNNKDCRETNRDSSKDGTSNFT